MNIKDLKTSFESRGSGFIPDLNIPSELKVLVLGPHPDDFDINAVTLQYLKNNGNPIEVGVCRTGSGVEDAYCPGASFKEIADLRVEEQRRSLKFFGLDENYLTFLQPDNDAEDQLKESPENFNLLHEFIEEKKPDIVFLPHGNDTNSAHKALYAFVRKSTEQSGRKLCAFLNRDPKTINLRPDLYMPFEKESAEWKAELLRFHDSQHQRNLRSRKIGLDERILNVNRSAAIELSISEKYAETFEIEFYNF